MWYLSTAGISLIFTIIVCRYSRDADAAAQQCMITGCNIRCKKLSFGTELTASCSADVHRNGVPLNETDKGFAIRSPADYGVYTCCSDDGILHYYVFPEDCEVCADGFITADITRHNLTHINVTCVIHIGIPYCCSLYETDEQPGSRQIKQGLRKAPTNLTSYYCSCSFTCVKSFKIISTIGSNSMKFDPTNFTSTVQSNSNGSLFMSPSVASVISTTAFVTTNATANYNATSTAATTGTSITTVTTPANGIATPSPTPTCVCNHDNQQRGSLIGEIIGSFMAGVVMTTILILVTSLLCIWTTKKNRRSPYRSRNSIKEIINNSTSPNNGNRRQNSTVRYHPTPISETAADIRESDKNTRTTSCSEDIPDVPGLDINLSSSNIDISSRRCSTSGNTQEVSANVEPSTQEDSVYRTIAEVTTPEQCTQMRNHVMYDQRRRSQSCS